jgi:hypothetical protein
MSDSADWSLSVSLPEARMNMLKLRGIRADAATAIVETESLSEFVLAAPSPAAAERRIEALGLLGVGSEDGPEMLDLLSSAEALCRYLEGGPTATAASPAPVAQGQPK